MSDPSGSLIIQLRRDGGEAAVSIGSSRPVTAARVFVGMRLADTAARLPLLYSICGTAQAAACAAACEQALGIQADAAVRERRRLLLAAETAREHLWRLLLDWPAALGREPASAAMAGVMRAYQGLRGLLTAAADPFTPGAVAAPLEETAVAAAADALNACAVSGVFGADTGDWATSVTDEPTLTDWAAGASTPAAALVRALLDEGLAGLGRCPVQPLPADADAWLGGRLADADADAFVAAPDWQGEPRETTPFARGLTEPLVADLVRRHGNGLLPRLAALLAELARACCALTGGERSGVQHRPSGQPGAGVGLGAAQAARGLLLHRVETADGRITGYRILAPTEWNFHPHGSVAAGLAAIAAAGPDEPAELERLARLHITAIDPCVAYTLSVS